MFIIGALLFICAINNTYSDKIFKQNIVSIKNKVLKRVIRNDIKRYRKYLARIKKFNNQMLTKYYDSIYSFNLMKDDDKLLIEYIISLTM